MIFWVKRGSHLHRHLRGSGFLHWFIQLNDKKHEEICDQIRRQTHDHVLSEEEVHAIAAAHQISDRKRRRRLFATVVLFLFLPLPVLGQGAINVIPQKQFMDAVNHAFNVTCVSGCSASAGFTDNTAFTVGTNSITNIGAYFTSGADPACTSGNACRLRIDSASNLRVNCVVGCAGGSTTPSDAFANPTTAGLQFDLLAGFNGTTWDRLRVDGSKNLLVAINNTPTVTANAGTGTFTVGQATGSNLHMVCDSGCSSSAGFSDNSAFTVGTTAINPLGGYFTSGADPTLSTGNAARARIDSHSYLFGDITAWAGTVLGAPSNYGTSPGAVAVPGVNAFITNTPAVTLASTTISSGTVTANQGGAPWTVKPDASTWTLTGTSANVNVTNSSLSVTQGTSPWVSSCTAANCTTQLSDGSAALGAMVNYGSTPTAVKALSANVFVTNTPTVTANAGTGTFNIQSNASVNIAQVNGSTVSTAATGVQKVGIVGNVGAAIDAAIGAAPPANGTPAPGLGSGATGGLLLNQTVCDTFVNVNVSTATTTLLITGVSGRQVRICALSLMVGAADNVALISGTGATCGTGTTGMTGGTTAASGYNFAANGGIAQGSGIGVINQTNATGDSVCVVTSAATQLSGRISYAIY